MPTDVITANSVPDLDTWGPDTYWNCLQWIEWHKALKSAMDIYQANVTFITEWNKQEMFAAGYDCRTFSSDFRAYAKENGFFQALYEGIGAIAQPIGWGVEVVTNAGNAASNAVEGVASITDTLKKFLPILVILILIGLLYFGYKTYLA